MRSKILACTACAVPLFRMNVSPQLADWVLAVGGYRKAVFPCPRCRCPDGDSKTICPAALSAAESADGEAEGEPHLPQP